MLSSLEVENALKPLASFYECAKDCPEMIVMPAGSFTMGSSVTEKGHYTTEGPQHSVTIAKPFAVSKFELTLAEWDACVKWGDARGFATVVLGGEQGQSSTSVGTTPSSMWRGFPG